ncbi:type 4a pilus biogenesis protein PilO [Kamptonema cortianum]|nr:type 4a pilus biogenesis protein PilO [Geitlerinema splendidum]MDK3155297.1 type 4a pilus biogenesis protein PilO [Kamptonema cortianum]
MKSNEAMKSVMLMALAVLMIGGGLVYWQYSAREQAEARVAYIESRIPDERELQSNLQKSQQELEDFRFKLEHLERNLPTAAYVPTLMKELEAVGLSNEVKVTGVRPVPITLTEADAEERPYKEIEFDISGQGTYRSVMNLVAALQKFPKVVSVRTVALAPRQDIKSNSRELDATVRLKAYLFKDDSDLSSKPSGANPLDSTGAVPTQPNPVSSQASTTPTKPATTAGAGGS